MRQIKVHDNDDGVSPMPAEFAEFTQFSLSSLTMQQLPNAAISDTISDAISKARAALPIDWQQLQQLSEGNEAFELELLQIFLTETQRLLQHAQRAILAHDIPQLSYVAHQIKGGSGNIGMGEMVRLAKALEHQSKAQDWENATTSLAQLNRSLTHVQAFLQSP
jgi:histidine phosphotransfer protein HptB